MALQTLNRILEHLYSLKGIGICSWVLKNMTKDYIIVDYPKRLKCKYLNNKYNGEKIKDKDPNAECYRKYVSNMKKIKNIDEKVLNKCLDYENELVILNTIVKESKIFYEKHYFYSIPELQEDVKNLADNCDMNSIKNLKEKVKKALDNEIKNKFKCDSEFNKINK